MPPSCRHTPAADACTRLCEFKWVLNNLHQLLHLAEDDGAPAVAAALESTIRITQDAPRIAAARRSSSESLVTAVREAGRVLNELTHQAHIAEALPAGEELGAALASIQLAAMAVTR